MVFLRRESFNIKHYLYHKFICMNLSLKSMGEGWENWGEGGEYELGAAFGDDGYPGMQFVQNVDDFLHKRQVQRVLYDAI